MIPDIGWKELMVVAVITLVVLGPNEIPRALSTVMSMVRKLRSVTSEFLQAIEDTAKSADLIDKDAPDLSTGLRKRTGEFEKTVSQLDPITEQAMGLKKTIDNVGQGMQSDLKEQLNQSPAEPPTSAESTAPPDRRSDP